MLWIRGCWSSRWVRDSLGLNLRCIVLIFKLRCFLSFDVAKTWCCLLLIAFLWTILLDLRCLLFLHLLLRSFDFVFGIVLLFKLTYQALLDVAEMRMLQPSELLQLLWPCWAYIALPPGSWGYGTGYQVLVGVDEFMILQAQQDEEFHILLDQVHAAFILHRAAEVLITCKQYALCHEDLYDIAEWWEAIHVEIELLENQNFLGHKLILLAVEALYLIVFAIQHL